MTEQQQAQGNGAEVAKRAEPPAGIALARRNLERFGNVLPEHVPAQQFVGAIEAALWASPDLMDGAAASPQAFYKVLMRCAVLGHIPGTDEFYLIPRKDKGRPSVQGIEGYRGIIERMYRSGAVSSVIVREVCKGDRFEFVEGVHDRPIHEVPWESTERGDADHPMYLVYSVAKLTTGAWSRTVVLNSADIDAVKASSDSASSRFSPWNRMDGGKGRPGLTGRSMWLKTAARRLEPWVPTSSEFRAEMMRAAAQANAVSETAEDAPRGVDYGTGEIHDAELVDDQGDADAQAAAEHAEQGTLDTAPAGE